jgi:hypothetical protein
MLIIGLVRQARLHLRDKGDRDLAKHMFDQTRSTQALSGYADVVRSRSRPLIAKATDDSG